MAKKSQMVPPEPVVEVPAVGEPKTVDEISVLGQSVVTVVARTAEEWAILKNHSRKANHLKLHPGAVVAHEGKITTARALAGKKVVGLVAVPDWRFQAAKAHERWPDGKMLTEEQYDAAVKTALNVTLR